jgi:6-phosphogluconate dehydrogenase (decarboxylating)
MGANMAERLLRSGHRVVGSEGAQPCDGNGAESAASLALRVVKLAMPRTLWLMRPPATPSTKAWTRLAHSRQHQLSPNMLGPIAR